MTSCSIWALVDLKSLCKLVNQSLKCHHTTASAAITFLNPGLIIASTCHAGCLLWNFNDMTLTIKRRQWLNTSWLWHTYIYITSSQIPHLICFWKLVWKLGYLSLTLTSCDDLQKVGSRKKSWKMTFFLKKNRSTLCMDNKIKILIFYLSWSRSCQKQICSSVSETSRLSNLGASNLNLPFVVINLVPVWVLGI